MRIYILDDDDAIIHTLRNVIEDYALGTVIGYSQKPEEAINEINLLNPDIVLIDLLMDQYDGIEILMKIENHATKAIMISQVNKSQLISKAYNAGVEFFINKPINIIEVVSVLKNTREKIKGEEKLKYIKNIFENGKAGEVLKYSESKSNDLTYIRYILNDVGIIGSHGKEIIKLYQLAINKDNRNHDIYSLINQMSDNPNATKQRIRRSIRKALTNIATLGIEDNLSLSFSQYSSQLFEFQDVKKEMDYLRRKSKNHGSINIEKFIYGLIILNELKD